MLLATAGCVRLPSATGHPRHRGSVCCRLLRPVASNGVSKRSAPRSVLHWQIDVLPDQSRTTRLSRELPQRSPGLRQRRAVVVRGRSSAGAPQPPTPRTAASSTCARTCSAHAPSATPSAPSPAPRWRPPSRRVDGVARRPERLMRPPPTAPDLGRPGTGARVHRAGDREHSPASGCRARASSSSPLGRWSRTASRGRARRKRRRWGARPGARGWRGVTRRARSD